MKAHYLMVGGFLGAGKTTALFRAGELLHGRGLRVGLIMNDQSDALVDTAIVRSRNLPVEEIAGGCFCCRFNSLVEAAERLERDATPDVFLAEPVGSCTDLAATVTMPLRHLYGDRYAVAPLSVLVDPDRALRVLAIEGDGPFRRRSSTSIASSSRKPRCSPSTRSTTWMLRASWRFATRCSATTRRRV